MLSKSVYNYFLKIINDFDNIKFLIISDYLKIAPSRLKVFFHQENFYSKKIDFFKTEFLNTAKGKYIAFCEGDDYWIDPHKLQKQVDAMEQKPDCALCFHNSLIWFESANRSEMYSVSRLYRSNVRLNTDDLIFFDSNITTSSMVFRRDAINFKENDTYELTEKALQLILSLSGDILYLKDVMSVYRSNSNSVSYGNSKYKATKLMISMYDQFDSFSRKRFTRGIHSKKQKMVAEYLYNKIVLSKGRIFVLGKPILFYKLVYYKLVKYSNFIKLNFIRR
jgi:hypothetical protein